MTKKCEGIFWQRGVELQSCCMARQHSLAIGKDDLDAWVGHFVVDVWRVAGDVCG
jgi:hypothetical protein